MSRGWDADGGRANCPIHTSSQPERGGHAGVSNGAEDRSCKVTPPEEGL